MASTLDTRTQITTAGQAASGAARVRAAGAMTVAFTNPLALTERRPR